MVNEIIKKHLCALSTIQVDKVNMYESALGCIFNGGFVYGYLRQTYWLTCLALLQPKVKPLPTLVSQN